MAKSKWKPLKIIKKQQDNTNAYSYKERLLLSKKKYLRIFSTKIEELSKKADYNHCLK